MQLGIFAKTFPGEAPLLVMRAAKQSGFQFVQYNMACSGIGALPSTIKAEHVVAIRRASDETGIAIAAVSATYNMVDPDNERKLRGRQAFENIARAANDMGTNLVTLCTGSKNAQDQWQPHPDNDRQSSWDEMIQEFEILLPIAQSCNVVLGVEPELANIVNSPLKARKLLEHFKSKAIGIVFDPANLFETEATDARRSIIGKALALLGPDIVLAHAKDRLPDGQFAAAGNGVLDWEHYIAALRNTGFDGTLVTHGLTAEEARGVTAFLAARLSA